MEDRAADGRGRKKRDITDVNTYHDDFSVKFNWLLNIAHRLISGSNQPQDTLSESEDHGHVITGIRSRGHDERYARIRRDVAGGVDTTTKHVRFEVAVSGI